MSRDVSNPPGALPPRLVLFPGLGISSDVFIPQAPLRRAGINLQTPGWIEPTPGESVERYSSRMAAEVEPRRPGERLFVGGLSFGGMIALEAARTLAPDGVVLISSGLSYRAIAPPVRWALRGLGLLSPRLLGLALTGAPLVARIVGPMDRQQRRFFIGLVPGVNLRAARWGAEAVLSWEFHSSLRCPVYHIHGQIDRITPLPRLADPRRWFVIPHAGHAVSVTRAPAVNRSIERCMTAT